MLRSRLLPAALAMALLSPLSAASAPPRPAPEIHGDAWLNSEPLTLAGLRGRVVLLEFWTFACRNCQNVEPHLKRWHARFAAAGLVTVAVHTPELDFERDLANLRSYVREQGIAYPVAVDNGFTTWRRYGNRAWPALYLIDRQGQIRHVRVGEGGYRETESMIEALLAEPAP